MTRPTGPAANRRAPTVRTTPIGPLGAVDPATFLATTWQRKPLLIRAAVPAGELAAGFPITEVLALARDPDVESRLVEVPTPDGRRGWRLRQGPFERMPGRRRPGWTVLVQGVDLHLDAGRALVDRFRFIPDARIDDLMISVASDGGGVGPHVDSYDVFLLQAHGRRRWRVGPPATRRTPHRLEPDLPLKILQSFAPTREWTLEPGDVLYLPPGWTHEGTAIGDDCMTCSIGFRAPSPVELRQAFFAALADADPAVLADRDSGRDASRDAGRDAGRYRDPRTTPTGNPAQIPPAMLGTLCDWIRNYRPDDATITRFIGCHLSEPKPDVWFDGPEDRDDGGEENDGPGRASGPGRQAGTGLRLDRRTRMLYAGERVFINGESLRPGRRSLETLRHLADRRALDAVETTRAMRDPVLAGTLRDWIASGWLHHADD